MNGDELVHKFIERIAVLETKMSERWDAHRRQSDEKWAMMQEEVAKIFEVLGKLTCKEQKAKIEWITWSVRLLWILIIGGLLRGILAIAEVVR